MPRDIAAAAKIQSSGPDPGGFGVRVRPTSRISGTLPQAHRVPWLRSRAARRRRAPTVMVRKLTKVPREMETQGR
jgi:hypothetical protein